ncbi:MAG TPA: hypothetical protein DEP72_03735 [Clostridiales bacterium]|nr:MAG: hypothetical protein A2Y18_05335 [Clostridiales bacterium GWD2_32_19]HCC07265.1 hypothetical protein [Clostridiales bacterium]
MSIQEARLFEEYKRDMRLKLKRETRRKAKIEKLVNIISTMIISIVVTISYLQMLGIDII